MSYTAPAGLGATTNEVTQATDKLAEAAALKVDPTKGKKYKTALAAAKWSGEQINRAAAAVAQSKAGRIVGSAGDMASNLLEMSQKKYSADASGVVDVAMDTSKFLNGFSSFASAVGGRAGAVMGEIASWGQVATGCAAGIAGAGVMGAVGCGLSVVAKVFSVFSGDPKPYVDPANEPRTLFTPRNTAMPLIAQDALRLAQVLKHHYNYTSYAGLVDRVARINDREGGFNWLYEAYATRPDIADLQTGKIGTTKDPIAGHNLRTVLQMLGDGDARQNDAGVSNALMFLAALRSRDNLEKGANGQPITGRWLWYRYQFDCDISEEAIAQGAYIGRSAVAQNSSAKLPVVIGGADWKHIGGAIKTYRDPGCIEEQGNCDLPTPTKLQADFLPFVQLDELLNYFGAITLRELRDKTQVKDASLNTVSVGQKLLNDYSFIDGLPLSQRYVRDWKRDGQPRDPTFEQTPLCRTNLKRSPDDCTKFYPALYPSMLPFAVREAAAIRLCAAFSYIHMQYKWSLNRGQTNDIIAAVDPIKRDDPAQEMRLPVDPRQVRPIRVYVAGTTQSGLVWTLHPNEKPGSTPAQLFRRHVHRTGDTHPELSTHTALVLPSPIYSTTLVRSTSDARVLAARIDEHEQIVQRAIAFMRAQQYDPALATSIREHMRLVLQGGASAGPANPYDRLKTLQSQLRLAPKQSLAGPLLIGAAAVLALKFLK